MPAKRPDVPDAELAVLKALWDQGEATIREIADRLYPGGETSHYATVQKLLDRLEERECVAKRRDGRVNIYSPTVAREDLIRHRLKEAADKLCEGSLTPLLTQLVQARPLSDTELGELRRLIDKIDDGEGSSR